ncbi:MAG: hypothetical protein ACSLFQ_09935 [Thermoanaerobaculia bacterium]
MNADNQDLPDYFTARDAYLSGFGEVDQNLLAPLMNPGLTGGPEWPGLRESWRRVRRGTGTILVSDGLSDPFDDDPTPNVGFGVEVMIETTEPLKSEIPGTWLFQLAYDVSQLAAETGAFREYRDELGLFSTEFRVHEKLRALASPEGRVGVLLGVDAPGLNLEWELPAGLVRVVTVTLLHPSELAFIQEVGLPAREEVARLLALRGTHHLSQPGREPVI